jgi:signal transduction histidine kinase
VPPVVVDAVRQRRWASPPPLALPVTVLSVSAVVVVASPVDRIAFPLLVAWLVGWLSLPLAGAVLLDNARRDGAGTVLSVAGLVPAVAMVVVGEQGLGAAVVASYLGAPAVALLGVLLPLGFPGRVRSPLEVRTAALAGGVALAAIASGLVARLAGDPVPRPWAAGGLATAAAAAAALALSLRTWRRLVPPDRDRRGWLLLGLAVWWAAVIGVVVLVDPAENAAAVYVLAGLTCALAAGVGWLRLAAEPVPLDLALARAGVAALAVAGVTATYLLAVALLARVGLPDSRIAAAVVASLTAVGLLPLWVVARNRLTARALGTGHSSSAAVLADLGRRLAQPLDQRDLLDSLAEGVAAAVRSPQVTIGLAGEPVAVHDEQSTVVPLDWAGEHVGRLVVRPRRAGERFRSRDLRLLAQLAPTVAAVAASAALGSRLEESEAARSLAARREREGVRRDLHDDLGPLLAGIGMQLAAASALLPEGSAEARRRIDAASGGVEQSRTAVRRLVDALAPAAQQGLPAAVQAVVEDWADAAGGRPVFRAEVDPTADLPPAGAAAVLRILGEALTNVVRHADARTCTVRLARSGDEVVLDVVDDGVGADGAEGSGVGTVSMRQRAEEIGGRLSIVPAEPRGTCVRAVVPVVPAP